MHLIETRACAALVQRNPMGHKWCKRGKQSGLCLGKVLADNSKQNPSRWQQVSGACGNTNDDSVINHFFRPLYGSTSRAQCQWMRWAVGHSRQMVFVEQKKNKSNQRLWFRVALSPVINLIWKHEFPLPFALVLYIHLKGALYKLQLATTRM